MDGKCKKIRLLVGVPLLCRTCMSPPLALVPPAYAGHPHGYRAAAQCAHDPGSSHRAPGSRGCSLYPPAPLATVPHPDTWRSFLNCCFHLTATGEGGTRAFIMALKIQVSARDGLTAADFFALSQIASLKTYLKQLDSRAH